MEETNQNEELEITYDQDLYLVEGEEDLQNTSESENIVSDPIVLDYTLLIQNCNNYLNLLIYLVLLFMLLMFTERK